MSTDLSVGDKVEVVRDYRPFLNNRVGVIVEIIDSSAIVQFDHVGRSRKATVLLENLVKVVEDGH